MAHYRKITLKTVDEWLKMRQSRIGGSEISAVIGLNPWESRYELYLRKKGDVEPKTENLAMRLGHKLENAVAELLQEETGYQIIKNTSGNVIYLSEDYPFAEASPDRIAYLPGAKHNEANKSIVEVKTTQKPVDAENIPEHWICQVQWYMGITGIKHAVICWLVCGRDFGYAEIPFEGEFFDFLVNEAERFIEDVMNGNEPDAVTAADVASKYPHHLDGKTNEVSEDVALVCDRYKEVKAQIKTLEEEKDSLEDAIKIAFKDAEFISYGGLTIGSYKSAKDSEKFDSKAFKAENPELAAKYTKTVPGARRLNIK